MRYSEVLPLAWAIYWRMFLYGTAAGIIVGGLVGAVGMVVAELMGSNMNEAGMAAGILSTVATIIVGFLVFAIILKRRLGTTINGRKFDCSAQPDI